MLGDNKTNFILTKDVESQNHTKHIDMMHDYIQELVKNKKLNIE